MQLNPQATAIGGLNRDGKPITVQIDESCLGKRKYNKGKYRKSTWVLGGITVPNNPKENPRFFGLTVPNRKKDTLVPILKEKIKPESNVHSDGWTSYYTLGQHFNTWEMVNHSKFFKDPSTGVNTNRIEGIWKHMRATMPGGSSRSKIEEYVQLFSFKEFCKTHPQY